MTGFNTTQEYVEETVMKEEKIVQKQLQKLVRMGTNSSRKQFKCFVMAP